MYNRHIRGLISLLLALSLILTAPVAAQAKWTDKNGNEIPSGENWFGEDFAYDITDTEAVWELLMKPITVLDIGEKEFVYPLAEPNGKKVYNDKLGGFINGATAAVHVLSEDQDGWTLIEGLDYYDRLITGYVKTSLLKTVTPNDRYGIVIDKMYQRLYFFENGELFSSCPVSTGLATKDGPYNETSAGEYITASYVGQFVDGRMYCDKVIRYNNGDAIHEVPYFLRADGSKSYSSFEEKLGKRASHGCIRVLRLPNDDGLCMKYIWDKFRDDNLRGVKLIIWDDDGRALPYPDDNTMVYYNPDGGKYYHTEEYCSSVKNRYLPLTGFTYAELDVNEKYLKLTPCPYCDLIMRKSEIDEENAKRGVETPVSTVSPTETPEAEEPATDDGAADNGDDSDSGDGDGYVPNDGDVEDGNGTVEVIIH